MCDGEKVGEMVSLGDVSSKVAISDHSGIELMYEHVNEEVGGRKVVVNQRSVGLV